MRRGAPALAAVLLLQACGATLSGERPPPLVGLRGVPLVYLITSGDRDAERIAAAVAKRVAATPAVRLQHTSEAQLAAERDSGFVPRGAIVVSLELEVARRTAVDWPERLPTPDGLPAQHAPPPPVVIETPVIVATLTFVARDATTNRELTRSTLVAQSAEDGDDRMREAVVAELVARLPSLFAPVAR